MTYHILDILRNSSWICPFTISRPLRNQYKGGMRYAPYALSSSQNRNVLFCHYMYPTFGTQ